MSLFSYQLDEDNAIRIYHEEREGDEPVIFQPHYPNGDAWPNAEAAAEWAQILIDSLDNPESEFIPGNSANQPVLPRPAVIVEETVAVVEEPVVVEPPVEEVPAP